MPSENEVVCADCHLPLTDSTEQCLACGSRARLRRLRTTDTLRLDLTEHVSLHVGPKMKSGAKKRARWQREYSERAGLWQQDSARPVIERQDIDRRNNRKVHEVRDASTHEILHSTIELLDSAHERGSAKPAMRAKRATQPK